MADASHSPAERCALTRSQLMIWTGQRLQPDEPLYNMALAFRIRGRIDAAKFSAAFDAVVANSDALRTTFASVGGVPKQVFHETLPYEMEMLDLTAADNAGKELDAWLRLHTTKPFDLEQCLFESTLLKLGEEDFVWFFNQHHLTTDAWSTSLIFREMQSCYTLAVEGRLAEVEVLPAFRGYVDYESRQRESKALQRASCYWQERLAEPFSPSTFYRATPASRSGRTLRVACEIGPGRSQALRALAERDGFRALTPDLARFQVFATAYFAWLYRITGNRTLTMGTPNHNRATSRHRNTIGLFIEIYPLRVSVEDGETFASLYQKVSRNTTELLMNAPSGASGFEHNRAYDVVLNYITAAFGDFAGMPAESRWMHADCGDRNHLLRMQVEDFDGAGEFRVFFDLNADTFIGDERQRPGRQFVRLLDGFAADPAQAIARVDILEADERAALLAAYAPASPGDLPVASVFERFLAQVARSPDHTAVTCGDESLTYAQLAERTASLAARFADCGVGKGDRIGIALPRSALAVTAFLASMRCGAAYVPIDPDYPQERIDGMLRDAAVRVVLVAADSTLVMPDGVEALSPDDAGDITPVANTACAVGPDDSAYVIFTSGSTGRPKGVDVTHRGLANYIAWAARYYLEGEVYDWPLFSSLSFDLTVTSIFVPLVTGGRIVVYPESRDRREILIRKVIEDNAVDIVKLTPAHLALLQVMDVSQSRLRKIIVGGENLKSDLARSVSRYFGGRIVIYNEYGPTEATVACMIHRFDPERDDGSVVPIGCALDNASIYLFSDALEPQPPGVVGELAIGGAGVARGYVNRPDLTAERFVANPLVPGEIVYRTGDLARSNADGTLTCLGRLDQQFKVNGVRVEAGEIEAVLQAHPQITDSAVRLVVRGAPGDAGAADFCLRCGLSSMHPDAALDHELICRICRDYETEAERAQAYFRTEDDLAAIVRDAREGSRAKQDCMMLLSGGKDSTYALCKLVDLGLTPLVFTLDNGFISDGAKQNIRRVVEELGLELYVGKTDAMKQIFVDSLHRFSNVCNGCFKTIYTLSMRIAQERGIRHIFTGLSRGQIFESRVADLFRQRIFDSDTIDRTIIDARKAYHRAHDAVAENLDTSHFDDDKIFETIQYVDYYRYTDVSLDEMLSYLKNNVPWVRPADTGRSTNCLINEAGIFVHKKERGYHNYALPYSWDVRLGHKERDAARQELDDDINLDNVQRILAEVGYKPRETSSDSERQSQLAAWYVASEEIPVGELRDLLLRRLPKDLVPAQFVRLERLPLTAHGKLDRDALPDPDSDRPQLAESYVGPGTPVEKTLATIWEDILGIDKLGVNDNFFELGGDSIMNIQIVAAAAKHGLRLSPQQVFDYPTIRELVGVLGTAAEVSSEQGPVTGSVPLTPIQHRFLSAPDATGSYASQQVLMRSNGPVDTLVLQEAVRQVVNHHDALRARFVEGDAGWQQAFAEPGAAEVAVERIAADGQSSDAFEALLEEQVERLQGQLDLRQGPLFRVVVFDGGQTGKSFVLLVAHQLVVDAVSWWVLLEDLEQACQDLAAGNAVMLPPKTTSMRHWAKTLANYAGTAAAQATRSLWVNDDPPVPLLQDLDGINDFASRETLTSALSVQDTGMLLTVGASQRRFQPQDILLTALLKTVCAWSGRHTLAVDVESHGREAIEDGLDLLRTVGCFTSIYPVLLSQTPDQDTGELLGSVRQVLCSVPRGGIACGALRYLAADSAGGLGDGTESPVLFNYLGKWRRGVAADSRFEFDRPVMSAQAGPGRRHNAFEITAAVFDGRLQVEWSFSRNQYRRDTISELLRSYCEVLAELVAWCADAPDTDTAPTDFSAAGLDQDELDAVLAEFSEN